MPMLTHTSQCTVIWETFHNFIGCGVGLHPTVHYETCRKPSAMVLMPMLDGTSQCTINSKISGWHVNENRHKSLGLYHAWARSWSFWCFFYEQVVEAEAEEAEVEVECALGTAPVLAPVEAVEEGVEALPNVSNLKCRANKFPCRHLQSNGDQ